MRRLFPITAVLVIVFFMAGGIVMVDSAGIIETRVVDVISVLDCPTIGFAIIHELDNDELLVNIETICPPDALAGAILEYRYGEGEEMVIGRTRVNEFGRATMTLKTARLTDQKLEGWIINAPEWAVEMFVDHPNFLLEEGNMHALATVGAL